MNATPRSGERAQLQKDLPVRVATLLRALQVFNTSAEH
jgi:hypothetical protein